MKHKSVNGHIAAFLTILIWGTTFISTKILLDGFSPIQILFIRFFLGYLALWLACPHLLKFFHWKKEAYFALAGLCGVTLYYLLENIALTYTQAANVGVIISIAPFFTALFDCLFLNGERPSKRFFFGLLLALSGVSLMSFGSGEGLALNPLGDILAVFAAIVWAIYSSLTKKISTFGYHTILSTRRTFFYGLLFMLPILFTADIHINFSLFMDTKYALNLLFLGFGASALCFVTWGTAIKQLGAVKTSVYIYMVPVITAVTSVVILRETINFPAVCGILLTLAGLFLSASKKKEKGAENTWIQENAS